MRSEAVVVVFLQKAKDAKRIYGTLVHAKTNCDGYKEEGITFPSSKMQRQLLEEFYDECGISPSCIKYIETHGTGTKIGDPEEVKAIEKVFCKDKLSPLLIGSVKSNMGHSEPASGLCQIIKVLTILMIVNICKYIITLTFILTYVVNIMFSSKVQIVVVVM